MTTMIERMAMAIYAKNAAAALGRQPWAKAQEAAKESARGLARAALEEMRVPTEGMVDAGNVPTYQWIDNTADDVWSRMIDAALKEDADAA